MLHLKFLSLAGQLRQARLGVYANYVVVQDSYAAESKIFIFRRKCLLETKHLLVSPTKEKGFITLTPGRCAQWRRRHHSDGWRRFRRRSRRGIFERLRRRKFSPRRVRRNRQNLFRGKRSPGRNGKIGFFPQIPKNVKSWAEAISLPKMWFEAGRNSRPDRPLLDEAQEWQGVHEIRIFCWHWRSSKIGYSVCLWRAFFPVLCLQVRLKKPLTLEVIYCLTCSQCYKTFYGRMLLF